MTLRVLLSTLAATTAVVALSLAGPALAAQKKSASPAAAGDPAVAGPVQQVERIAAVVNDEVISFSDLNARIDLVLLGASLPDTPEARQRVRPQVLRSMVEERLQSQEAKRLNITVSKDEMDKALGRLAEQNKLARADMEKLFASRGVPWSTLENQVRASLAWSKVVQRRLRSSVQIGDDEIDAVLERIKANAGKPEYLVAEIFLAVDSPDQDDEVLRLGERLVEQLSQGTPFVPVARQFSQAAGAAGGGDLGWVQAGQLPEELDGAIQQLRPGQISRPVRSATGYHILYLRDQRTVASGNIAEMKVALKQVVFPTDGDPAAARSRVEEQTRNIRGCEAMDAMIQKMGGLSGDLGTVRVGDMPPQIGRLVATLSIGQPSVPLVNEREARVLMVCERSDPPGASLPGRDEIAAALGGERLEMLARRYLRDLRRSAFIELRV